MLVSRCRLPHRFLLRSARVSSSRYESSDKRACKSELHSCNMRDFRERTLAGCYVLQNSCTSRLLRSGSSAHACLYYPDISHAYTLDKLNTFSVRHACSRARRRATSDDAWGNWGADTATLESWTNREDAPGASRWSQDEADERAKSSKASTSSRPENGSRSHRRVQDQRQSWRSNYADGVKRAGGSHASTKQQSGTSRKGFTAGTSSTQRTLGRQGYPATQSYTHRGERHSDRGAARQSASSNSQSRMQFVDRYGNYREEWEAQMRNQNQISTARAKLVGNDMLYGVAPVHAALDAKRRRIHALYIQDSLELANRKDAGQLKNIKQMAQSEGIMMHYTSKHIMNDFADQRPHQGVMLDCDELFWESMPVLPTAQEAIAAASDSFAPVWLVMDQVHDPQNMGAMVRSAYYLGASGIIGSQKNCAPLSAVASKASAGVMEVWQMFDSSNLARTLEHAVSDGWQVLGADSGQEALSCESVSVSRPTLLVMGNEGYGLRTNVRRACTGLVKIDASRNAAMHVVDSLNVSVATGILLQHLISCSRKEQCHATAED